MKTLKSILITLVAILALALPSFAQVGASNTLAPNTKFKGSSNEVPSGVTLKLNGTTAIGAGSTTTLSSTASAPVICRSFLLGTPETGVTSAIVASANMKVGAYTLKALTNTSTLASGIVTFAEARNITVTGTTVSGADTLGTVLVTGTDINGVAITETLTPANGSTVAGLKAFKTVSSIVGTGWVINTTADTIVFGSGDVYGLPAAPAAAGYALTLLDATIAGSVVTTNAAISLCTVAVASGAGKQLTVYFAR